MVNIMVKIGLVEKPKRSVRQSEHHSVWIVCAHSSLCKPLSRVLVKVRCFFRLASSAQEADCGVHLNPGVCDVIGRFLPEVY